MALCLKISAVPDAFALQAVGVGAFYQSRRVDFYRGQVLNCVSRIAESLCTTAVTLFLGFSSIRGVSYNGEEILESTTMGRYASFKCASPSGTLGAAVALRVRIVNGRK